MKKLGIFLLALGLLIIHSPSMLKAGATAEDKAITAKVDKLFAEFDKSGSPGASLAVAKEGQIIYKKGYGNAHLEYGIPITPSTIFHVASVSKQFTAFAITMLANQGKLSLNDPIQKHVPEVPNFAKTTTLKQLIHHTSGIRDQWELLAMAGWRLDDVITKEHILNMVKHQKDLNFNPGDEHLYSNMGYTLLAVSVERVTGKSFREWTQENMFKPLGMTNTHFHDDHEMIVKNRAYSYGPSDEGGFKKSVLSYANVGATSLFTTVEDLAKWAHNFEDPRVGGKAVIEQMYEVGVLNNGEKLEYAFGLMIQERKGLRTVSHSGGDAGFRSHIVMFPDQKLSVSVLSNLGSFNPGGTALQVADIYLADRIDADDQEKKDRVQVKVDPAIYDRYEGTYSLDTGMVIKITRKKDKLMGEAVGQAKFELFPESETKFFVKIADAQITFHPEKEGKVQRFTLHMGGQDEEGKRVESTELTSAQLAEYPGEYYSEELGTTYVLVAEGKKLVAQHRRHGDNELIPSDPDQFSGGQWWLSKLRFTRGEDKKITGFHLTGSRVRNLRFDKVN